MKNVPFILLSFLLASCQQNKKLEKTLHTENTPLQQTTEPFVQKIIPHPINCFDLPNILEAVSKRDHENRVNEIIPEIDRKNLEIVVSIIENCGMPTAQSIDKKHIATIFLVLQHGDNYHRKKYFPLIEKAVENGDLQKSDYALMKDRILVSDGKPQIYGTQVISGTTDSNKLEVAEIEAPEYVDQRRAEMGLPPINDYLKMWDISLDIEQKKK